MRPLVICFAYTSTALIIAGCSSTGSIARPFKGSSGVASSAKDFSEYDRDPPAPRNSPRMASEPSPVPPARGISLSRTVEVTPTGFRRRQACIDSCTDDQCTSQGCVEEGCEAQPRRLHCFGIHLKHIFDGRRLARFKGIFHRPCIVGDSCTDQGCGSYPVQETQTQTQECLSENHPRMAPPLGEQTKPYDDGRSGHSLQQKAPSSDEAPMAPETVPDIPVDPISQNRPVAPPAWHDQPMYSSAEAGQAESMSSERPVQLELPVWAPYGKQGQSPIVFPGPLTPSASPLKTPATINIPDKDFQITIQPLARVSEADSANRN